MDSSTEYYYVPTSLLKVSNVTKYLVSKVKQVLQSLLITPMRRQNFLQELFKTW